PPRLRGLAAQRPRQEYGGRARRSPATPVGNNQVGEPCNYRQDSPPAAEIEARKSYSVRCGSWQQPSGRVHEAIQSRSGIDQLNALASGSPWRGRLDQILSCGTPTATRILDGIPASLVQCTRR